ncbi:MAG: hypothetical protein QW390_04785, partial [Candidatus Bathyarchaeia archaeon]
DLEIPAGHRGEVVAKGPAVEWDQVFPLMVGVSYSVPEEITRKAGGYVLWLTLDGRVSNLVPFGGPGAYTFQFSIRAPPVEGVYSLKIELYIAAKPDYPNGQLRDTETFTYYVKPKVVTDWEVEKAWITPSAPGPGDEVTFHASIALLSTNSKQALSVEVMCYLDKKQFTQAPIVLTFNPTPYTQEVTVAQRWTATEGDHRLIFTVDQMGRHNDPTPYPRYNFKELAFRVEPYYAVIHDIKTPQVVDPGESFDIAVGVRYDLPANTRLKVVNVFAADGAPQERLDTVSGEGINSYLFTLEAPQVPFARPGEPDTMPLNGSFAQVEFDRGSGWQHTDPGWRMGYVIQVRRPTYYAVFDSVEARYLGTEGGSGRNATLGRFQITMHVRHLLPLETGLRLVVTGYNGSTEVLRTEEEITQTDSVERTTVYTNEYTFPLTSLAEGSYSIGFEASVEYMVEGSWYWGDGTAASAQVNIVHPPKTVAREHRTILDDLKDRLDDFLDWMRRMLGMGPPQIIKA